MLRIDFIRETVLFRWQKRVAPNGAIEIEASECYKRYAPNGAWSKQIF